MTISKLSITVGLTLCLSFLALIDVPRVSAADRVACTGADLQSGNCKPIAGENFTIDLTDLNLSPGQYAIKYQQRSQSDFYLRCPKVGNNRKLREEAFPGSGIGPETLGVWKIRTNVNPCSFTLTSRTPTQIGPVVDAIWVLFQKKVTTINSQGTEISGGKFKIDFQPSQWKARVTDESLKRNPADSVKIVVENVPAEGDYKYRLQTSAAKHTDIKSRGKSFEFSVDPTLYRPGIKLIMWRWSGNALENLGDSSLIASYLGEATIGDANPCAAEIGACTRSPIDPGTPGLRADRPRYAGRDSVIPCGDGGIETGLGCIPVDASALVSWVLRFSLGIGGGAALLLMSFSGIQIMISQGDPEKLNEGKERFTSALIGLVFIILSVFLLTIIGVDILGTPPL